MSGSIKHTMEDIQSELDDRNSIISDADGVLDEISEEVSGWGGGMTLALKDRIRDVSNVLIAAIKDRDARIQRLHLKLGQAAERL